ncbi:MAG TPA: SpoIID/LytB domain-containing protein, partial [Vicinamibacterales bacterium]
LTHCQVMGARTKGSDEAAQATSGQALFFAGQLATVFYTASCGGHSERASDVWPGGADQPYLPARAEPGCRAESRWQSDVSASDLQHALVASGRRGQVLRNLAVLNRTQSGRVSRLLIDGFEPAAIAGEEFRLAVGRTLGWQVLKSTLFDVERIAAGYRFRGSGRGHGVGLCVVGSVRMAAGGQSALEILSRYFPGAEVHTAEPAAVPRSGLRLEITVPAGEERERYRVEGFVQAALLEFSARIGVPVPAHVEIVFHPTVEAYTRATGQPWWTAGASRGNRIDLMPLSALRQRGVLEGTLRHEVAHVLTSERLKGRPTWVEEAVAMDLAGDSRAAENGTPWAGSGAPALSCPTDAEWRSIRSEDELRKAYRRAAACFAVQRAAGRRWDEIR